MNGIVTKSESYWFRFPDDPGRHHCILLHLASVFVVVFPNIKARSTESTTLPPAILGCKSVERSGFCICRIWNMKGLLLTRREPQTRFRCTHFCGAWWVELLTAYVVLSLWLPYTYHSHKKQGHETKVMLKYAAEEIICQMLVRAHKTKHITCSDHLGMPPKWRNRTDGLGRRMIQDCKELALQRLWVWREDLTWNSSKPQQPLSRAELHFS